MAKFIVVYHAHHPDEGDAGIYHLTFAEALEQESQEPLLVGHQEVVWHAGDERWQGREPDEIAKEQRLIVSEMLTQRAAELERAEAEAQSTIIDLGGIGQEL